MNQTRNPVLYERKGPSAWIWFDRDEKRNAWTPELVEQFQDCLEEADNDPEVRCVVVSGKGKCFCAGMDLAVAQDLDLSGYREYYRKYENLRETIKWVSKPVIARINGDAYGDGVAILECFDIIVAVAEARFGLREINAGLGAGGLLFFDISRTRALELCITGRTFSGTEGENWGLITKAVAPDQLDECVEEYIEIFSKLPPVAVSYTKRVANMVLSIAGQDAARKVMRELQINTFDTKDREEAMLAFLEKRKPVFKGG